MAGQLRVADFEEPVSQLLSHLPETVGRARVLGIYVSLRIAEDLAYDRGRIRPRTTEERTRLLSEIPRAKLLHPKTWSNETREWMAGYYFNNALLRMAAIAEITLKVLFATATGKSASPNYKQLVTWYENTYKESLAFLSRTRQDINAFKHGPRSATRELELMEEGVAAFQELLALLNYVKA